MNPPIEIRQATLADLRFIEHLQARHKEELGFIPPTATQREIEWGHAFYGSSNADDAGFLLLQPALGGQRTTAAIIQAAVRMDARRMGVGLSLVEAVAMKATRAGSRILQCWCREDLESNAFWEAAGFEAITTRAGGNARGIRHTLWRRALTLAATLRELPSPGQPHGAGGRFCRK